MQSMEKIRFTPKVELTPQEQKFLDEAVVALDDLIIAKGNVSNQRLVGKLREVQAVNKMKLESICSANNLPETNDGIITSQTGVSLWFADGSLHFHRA